MILRYLPLSTIGTPVPHAINSETINKKEIKPLQLRIKSDF